MSAQYPEHEKLLLIPREERDAIADFLEWLAQQGIRMGIYVTTQWKDHVLVEFGESADLLMHRFWEIDKAALAAEKDAMLEAIRRREP